MSVQKSISIIIFIGALVFCNGLFNGFVGDDTSQIVTNPLIQSFHNIVVFFKSSTFYHSGNLGGIYYKPIQTITFALIHSIFGLNPLGFHLFEITLHILNACILFIFFNRFFQRKTSLVLSLIFLVHPLNEPALYISDMQDVLFFFFGMLAISILAMYHSKLSLFFVGTGLLLSLLSKETGVLFIPVAIMYCIFYSRDKLLPLVITSIAAFSFYLGLRFQAIGLSTKASSEFPIDNVNLLTRSFTMPAIFLFYIATFFFPLYLSISYEWIYAHITFKSFYMPLFFDVFFLLGISFFAFLLHKAKDKKRLTAYIFFTVWTLMGIAMHLQIIPLDLTVSDRWFYFPMVGILGMIGIIFEAYALRIHKNVIVFIVTATLLLLSTRTFIRTFDWRDEITIDTHDMQVAPDAAYNLNSQLSYTMLMSKKFIQAKEYAEASIKLHPYFDNYNNLGAAYMNLEDFEKAKNAYIKASKYGEAPEIYENLGLLILKSRSPYDNADYFTKALKKYPDNATIWEYFALQEYAIGNYDKAKDAISHALNLSSSDEILSYYNTIMNMQPLTVNFFSGKPLIIQP